MLRPHAEEPRANLSSELPRLRPSFRALALLVLVAPVLVGAQGTPNTPTATPSANSKTNAPATKAADKLGDKKTVSAEPVAPISDNSFLIEEAYNQEAGVVQHISTFSRINGSKAWGYSFTQEWPVVSQKHQFSYTVPLAHTEDFSGSAVGDVMLNYRYQLVLDEESGWAISPRLSYQLPTGDVNKAMGLGGAGWQVNLPVSKTLGESFVTHFNVGGTIVPHEAPVLNGNHDATMKQYFAGQSLIWLAHPNFNLMVEAIWSRSETTVKGLGTTHEDQALLVPGFRGAINVPGGLQIVPGVGFPIGVGASKGVRQLFLYVSFEHPFSSAGK